MCPNRNLNLAYPDCEQINLNINTQETNLIVQNAINTAPVPVARSLRPKVYGRSPAAIVGSNPTGDMDVCLFCVCVVCCRVEVSATGWSLVQGTPTDCGTSLCVITKPREQGGHSPRWASEPEKNYKYCVNYCKLQASMDGQTEMWFISFGFV
jgi:hypothetical protein